MCGIAGYYTFGDKKPDKVILEAILLALADRGKDATGIAFVEDNKLHVRKGNVEADVFIDSEHWSKIINLPKCMIMHARHKTKGSPDDNTNNHPVFSKTGIALAHNGVIKNDDKLFTVLNCVRDGKVDTEILLRLIEQNWWDDILNLNKAVGTFAITCINKHAPDELILARHDEPITFHIDTENDILYFASESNNMNDALMKRFRGFPVGTISTAEMKDDVAILINNTGIVKEVKLDVKSYVYTTMPSSYYSYGGKTTIGYDYKSGKYVYHDKTFDTYKQYQEFLDATLYHRSEKSWQE